MKTNGAYREDCNCSAGPIVAGRILSGVAHRGRGRRKLAKSGYHFSIRHLHRYYNFTELTVETVSRSLHHSCRSELTRQGISLP